MKELHEVREEYGGVYVTVFNDGLLVPWKPLSVGDFIRYQQDYNRGATLPARLEDEIFRKCVVDPSIIRQLRFLKAGVITTVVLNIWDHSGPSDIDRFQSDLDSARALLHSDQTKALNDLVQIVSMAFPYKPEEIYAMEYETFMFRVAQSEKKLIEMHLIESPITIKDTRPDTPQKRRLDDFIAQYTNKNQQPEDKPRIDAKKLWDAQQANSGDVDIARQLWEQHQKQFIRQPPKKPEKVKASEVKTTGRKHWKVSPVLEVADYKREKIDFATEAAELAVFAASGHEMADAYIDRVKMVQDTVPFYKDLIDELAKRKQSQSK